jgi:hypothetical protein
MTDIGEAPDGNTPAELLARLRQVLPQALPNSLTVSGPRTTAGNDLYEAFLFTLVLRAARNEGYRVSFADGNGKPPVTFRLRRAPGRIASGNSFTHAVLTLPNTGKDALEVHTGIAVVGRSKVAHEADVLVLRETVAQRCRQLGIDPASSHTLLVVEGKYYTTPLDLGLGRQFLGLRGELTTRSVLLAATVTHPSVVHLLEGRKQSYEVGVLPGRKAEHDLQERFAMSLRAYRQGR